MPRNASGEVAVSASIEGRQITLEPLIDTPAIEVQPRRVETTIPCGFQVHWGDGAATFAEVGEVTFDISCGAGVGSRWLTLCVKDADGEVFAYECLDVNDLLKAWLDRVERDGRTAARA
jgi:hypothetical protein